MLLKSTGKSRFALFRHEKRSRSGVRSAGERLSAYDSRGDMAAPQSVLYVAQ
jgi:hypothetical protein